MTILAIETSCDETAIAVVSIESESVTIQSNILSSQINIHIPHGGVVPNLAAREHERNLPLVLAQALDKAEISEINTQIDVLAVTVGPGLAPALVRGVRFAKELAQKYNKPLLPVSHLEGHLYSNWLGLPGIKTPFLKPDQVFPALCLIVSGGHTELIYVKDYGQYELLGQTLDDAVGEAFDKVARLLDLGYPGGPALSRLAMDGDPKAFNLPTPMTRSKNLNFSYSGLKTAVLYLVRRLTNETGYKFERQSSALLTQKQKSDLAASFQQVAVEEILAKTRLAIIQTNPRSLMVSGGVSANQLLRSKLTELAQKFNLPYFQPDLSYTGDNAAMIAMAAYFRWLDRNEHPIPSLESIDINANLQLATSP